MNASRTLPALAIAAVLALAGGAGDARAFALRRSVVGNAATPVAGVGDGVRRVNGTMGQAVVRGGQADGRVLLHGFWARGGVLLVDAPGAREGGAPIGAASLGAPRPNPVRGEADFTMVLPARATARVDVFDVQGRMVDVAFAGPLAAGAHRVRWTARVAPGVYLARLTLDGRAVSERRVVVTR